MPERNAPSISLGATVTSGGVRGRILVVDDEINICRLLERYLSRLGHEVETASSVPAALQVLEHSSFDLVLTDLRLPGPSGLDLLSEVRKRTPATRMMLMSAHADITAAVTAVEKGIDQLIVKPFELDELRSKITDSLRRHSDLRNAEQEHASLKSRLQQREEESQRLIVNGALSLAAAVEAKDEYTAGHAERVTVYALIIARVSGGIDLESFELAGKLHDVGKIGVPDSVLNKPGRLTNDEFGLVTKHPADGVGILQWLIDDPLVLGVVRSHHERWDGRGYPDGLAAEQIPFAARVLAVADTIDAMSSSRAYRRGLAWEKVVDEIRTCSGAQFDPAVVAVFEQCLDELAETHHRFTTAAAPPPSPA